MSLIQWFLMNSIANYTPSQTECVLYMANAISNEKGDTHNIYRTQALIEKTTINFKLEDEIVF